VESWKCQFEKPTIKALIGELEPESGVLINDLRRSILKIVKKKARVEWMGMSWGWCEHTALDKGRMLIGVHVVCDPKNPRVAVTLATSFFEKFPPSVLPKLLHSGLGVASCIGHQTWCEWGIGSQEMSDALVEFIKLSHGS